MSRPRVPLCLTDSKPMPVERLFALEKLDKSVVFALGSVRPVKTPRACQNTVLSNNSFDIIARACSKHCTVVQFIRYHCSNTLNTPYCHAIRSISLLEHAQNTVLSLSSPDITARACSKHHTVIQFARYHCSSMLKTPSCRTMHPISLLEHVQNTALS